MPATVKSSSLSCWKTAAACIRRRYVLHFLLICSRSVELCSCQGPTPDEEEQQPEGSGTTRKRKKAADAEKWTLEARWEETKKHLTYPKACHILKVAEQFGAILRDAVTVGRCGGATSTSTADDYSLIWTQLKGLVEVATAYAPQPDEIDRLARDIKSWGLKFVSLFGGDCMTPYIHLFVAHSPQYLRHYGSLGRFGKSALDGQVRSAAQQPPRRRKRATGHIFLRYAMDPDGPTPRVYFE